MGSRTIDKDMKNLIATQYFLIAAWGPPSLTGRMTNLAIELAEDDEADEVSRQVAQEFLRQVDSLIVPGK